MELTEPPRQVLGLVEMMRVLRRRWRWVAGSSIALTALALGLSLQQDPQYVAQGSLLLPTVADSGVLQADPNAQVAFFADRQVKNALQVLQSGELQTAVERAYSGPLDVTKVTAAGALDGSDAVTLSVKATDPKAAAALVNTYATTYIDYASKQRLDSLQAAYGQLQVRLDDLATQRDKVAAPLNEIDLRLTGNPTNPSLQAQRAAILSQIQPQLDALDQQRSAFVQSQQSLALTLGLIPEATAHILTKATPPSTAVSPNPLTDAIVGLMLGLGLGLALALVREILDESIRSSDDLEQLLRGRYPVLGVIPLAIDGELSAGKALPDHTPVAEAFRSLRTSVRFSQLEQPLKIFQVTSASQGDGKTTAASYLSRALAQAGHQAGVVCSDLRRPSLHLSFGVPQSPGLTDVVLGERTLTDALQTIDNIYVLPAGTSPPNPSELLGTARTERVLEAMADKLDVLIVDSTPVLDVTDAVVVSRFVDATIVVISARTTTRRRAEETIKALEQAGAPILGFVLNRAGEEDRNIYGYTYGGTTVPADKPSSSSRLVGSRSG